MVEPPYLYGVFPGPKEESAAFWCDKDPQTKAVELIIVERGRVTARVAWDMFPGGLSIQPNANEDLSGFRYVDNPERAAPSTSRSSFSPLRSEYDGVIVLFYRLNGEWLFEVWH